LKITRFPTLKARDLDLGSGHTAYRRASVTDLYLHAKFHLNQTNFLWTYGRTYVHTYGQTFETGFIGSTLLKSRPKHGWWNGARKDIRSFPTDAQIRMRGERK